MTDVGFCDPAVVAHALKPELARHDDVTWRPGALVEDPRRDHDPDDDDKDRDDTPETPPTDPPPVPVKEPPATPGQNGPYVVGHNPGSPSRTLARWGETRRSAVDGVRKERRGFASMSPEKQREIASKGGRAAHEKGTAHEWTPDEARAAGRKGGQISRGGRGRLVSTEPDRSTLEAAPTSGMGPGRAE